MKDVKVMKPKQFDSIIIGGGVIGCSIAYSLSKRNKSVLLIEKNEIGCESSRAAAGMLGVQAELDKQTPLFELARLSREMFPSIGKELRQHTNIDIELIQNGQLKIAYSEEDVEAFQSIAEWQSSIGEEVSWLNKNALLNLEPCLSEKAKGALYFPNEGHVSAPPLTQAFAKAAAALGTKIREYCEVEALLEDNGVIHGVQTNAGTFYSESVVVATGAWSRKWLPDEMKQDDYLYPVKGEAFAVKTHYPFIHRTIFTKECYIVPKKGGELIVGATMKSHTFDQNVSLQGISKLMNKAQQILPIIADTTVDRFWSGIRPMTHDETPYLGEHPDLERLFFATGHYRNGILLSPITGKLMAELITDKSPSFDLSPFKLDRHKQTQEVIT
ncbi:glycine oxidase ThiO [Aquibacillus albus]|uniref:glycine oxidase n=1 Tax=Aquibacillus albus TaxID=1168171 RepID=A0ABS2N666_9BACI|nr:glycine oxidase ThiO [Aquibacillus albus]MBM7573598.1 glycine oxidase [Aquibacillus albus]